MNQPKRSTPFGFVLLLLIGIGAMALAFWLIDHRQAILDSGTVIAVSVGVFFITFTWAFFSLLRWRDTRRTAILMTAPPSAPPHPELLGTVYGLIPGQRYQVIQSFTDYYGNSFQRGERLRFKQRHFLPYDGGHTIVFDERPLYLQEDKNAEILDSFSDYVAQIKQ